MSSNGGRLVLVALGGRLTSETLSNALAHRGDQRILGVEHIVRGENGGAEKDLDRARPHPETALGKNLAPTPNRDWNDGNACLQSQDKTALLERKQTTIGAASSLRKHDDRNAATNDAHCPVEPADRFFAVGPIDEDESGEPERPAEYRDVEKLTLGNDSEIRRHGDDQSGDVELALVVCDINAGDVWGKIGVGDRPAADTIRFQDQHGQIGRASCRERVEMLVGDG